MAKLRRNYESKGTSASSGTITKVGIFGAILAGLVYFFSTFGGDAPIASQPEERIDHAGEGYVSPVGTDGQVIQRDGFTLSYDEDWEQAEWVAYVLERKNLQQKWSERPRNFKSDPLVTTKSATDNDYRGSGYDRGHLAPFADFAWSERLGKETFFLSNISPQARQFNQGVWRELEELTRDWANRFKRLYIVTGPVMTEDPKGTIGRTNRVAIPAAYYKVILDLDDPEQKAIGFVIPNEISFDPLPKYALSVDQVEDITGIDFFSELMPSDLEDKLESNGNPDLWPFSKKKFDKRVNSWNNVRD